MTEFQVPQFIDIEDKVIGPFTIKQFLWLLSGGAIVFVLWTAFPLGIFILVGAPIAALFLGFAFYQPNGRPMASLVASMMIFLFSPKTYVWRTKTNGHGQIFETEKLVEKRLVEKLSKSRLKDLAWKLDQ